MGKITITIENVPDDFIKFIKTGMPHREHVGDIENVNISFNEAPVDKIINIMGTSYACAGFKNFIKEAIKKDDLKRNN